MVFAKLLAGVFLAMLTAETVQAQIFQPIAGVPCYEPLVLGGANGQKVCGADLQLAHPPSDAAAGGPQELCCDPKWLKCRDDAHNCAQIAGYCGNAQWGELMNKHCKKTCQLC
ncbi:hypothetical protein AAVH_28980 [Aphelenchoides avenae]|nr:hypothetical protein AAVH_28980 [Aphelenchus avenae]